MAELIVKQLANGWVMRIKENDSAFVYAEEMVDVEP